MGYESKRATVYLDADLLTALKMKSAVQDKSVSELVNDAVRDMLREDAEDLAAFDERAGQPLVAFEDMVKWLKADGKL
ncbi:CopG family transcriptional regulator [bacterium]|nr:CopG family transcriptional regulator [bacterium]